MKNLHRVAATLATYLAVVPAADAKTYFYDDFETGDFSKWSYVQGQDPNQGGPGPQYVYVTTAAKAGVPQNVGPYVAHFERPISATNNPHAKVFKEWSTVGKLDQFHRPEDPIFNNGNVSAIYVAWYYFPATYTTSHEWVNIFQFKEMGTNEQGKAMQNPSWWINVASSSAFNKGSTDTPYPILFANHWGDHYENFHPKYVRLPLGQWFKISANLYQGDHIDWYLNGKKFDTSYNDTWPVGRFYRNSTGWIFGVGHYLGNGSLYVNHVGVDSLN